MKAILIQTTIVDFHSIRVNYMSIHGGLEKGDFHSVRVNYMSIYGGLEKGQLTGRYTSGPELPITLQKGVGPYETLLCP